MPSNLWSPRIRSVAQIAHTPVTSARHPSAKHRGLETRLPSKVFDFPPIFNSVERKRSFDFSTPLQDIATSLRTASNQLRDAGNVAGPSFC